MKTKLKYMFSFFIILFLALSSFPISQVNGQVSSSLVVGSQAYWLQVATNAWQYFQPGIGVSSATGLHYASIGFPYFTGWDLSVYLFAIMDAQQLGLISNSGTWGLDYRVSKVLSFLQTMQLTVNNEPYLWYDATTSLPAKSISDSETNACDYGSLLVALHRLQLLRPDLAETIDNIVKVRINSGRLASSVTANIPYDYYVANGFKYFGYNNYPAVSNALNVLNNMAALPKINVNGILLPKANICFEPLLLGMANLDSDPALASLTYSVYLANEARYNATGKFTAFSEGNSGLDNATYVYEWVVKEDGSTWTIDNVMQDKVEIVPIIYFKVAACFLAYYNSSYAMKIVSYLEPRVLTTSNGYMEGIDESGRVDYCLIDKTNGVVLDAAWYAIHHSQVPSPTPSLSPFPTPTPTSKSFPNPSPTPSQTPVPSQTPNPPESSNSTPSPSSIPSANSSTTEINLSKISDSLIFGVVAVAVVFCILLLFEFFRKKVSNHGRGLS